jgi:L-lactate dehydrogenase (cytochrome)
MHKLSRCYSIEDLKKMAKSRIPSVMFDYIQGGAEDEITLNRNNNAFNDYAFVPRVLRDVSQIDLSTKIMGLELQLPIISAPTGMSCMFHHQGEIAVSKASHHQGTAYSLSTVSTQSIEKIASIKKGPLFFQVYIWNDKKFIADFINRCKKNQYDAIMLAVDLAALGKRERDLKNGYGNNKWLKINVAKSAITKPFWLYNYFIHPKWKMANMTALLPHGAEVDKVAENINHQFNASITWKEVTELKSLWNGNFILKGIQSVEDAILAAEMGVTGIVVSNHGGRQLDHAPATLDLLPEIVDAVGSKVEVMLDGGISRGSDVVKALALGAKACFIGKPYLYGLAAGGEQGVNRCYEILKEEMTRTMKLIGCKSIAELNSSYVKKIK